MNWVCIDFGTCNTAAAIEVDGAPLLVKYGNYSYFPTVACVLGEGNIQVCQNAEPLRTTYPERFRQEFKLQIGDTLDLNATTYTEIVRDILAFVKRCAEMENNDKEINQVVLTIPAIYTENDIRKTVMRNAAKAAGFQTVEFLSEPVAAAQHYADIMGKKKSGLTVIYDLGGGTFDLTLLDMTTPADYRILGSEVGVKCGGQFFDKALYQYIATQCKNDGTPLLREKRLEDYAACKRIKEAFSIQTTASQLFSHGKLISITRDCFNQLIQLQIELTLKALDNLISTANKKWTDISQILFVGGSTAIPLIKEMLQKHLASHNATMVKIIRNQKGEKGTYDHTYATCLGGIAGKIIPPPPPPEPIATLLCGEKVLHLKMGENKFGRDADMDFTFDDASMSLHHFTIHVTRASDGKLTYNLTSCSRTKATVVNNMEALDVRYAPISRVSIPLQDSFTIRAGRTMFQLKK